MSVIDIVLIVAIAAALVGAICFTIRKRKKGGCCGDCSGCSCCRLSRDSAGEKHMK